MNKNKPAKKKLDSFVIKIIFWIFIGIPLVTYIIKKLIMNILDK
jgi:hypothetical protein